MTGFAGLAPCVHCGFCLQSCPTFLVTGDEADGPRGRIVLMRGLADGTLAPDDEALRTHLDRCLGCRACEPVCPSGVRYGPALEAARERIGTRRPVAPLARLVLSIMVTPAVRKPLMALARLFRPALGWLAVRGRVGFALGMVAASRPLDRRIGGWADRRIGERDAAEGDGDAVAVFQGCIQSGLFGHVNRAAERTLTVNGYRPVTVRGQGCCGALHAHAGMLSDARHLARVNVRAFAAAPAARVVATAAGCGAMLEAYGELLADDPLADDARALSARVSDVTEALSARGPRPGAPWAVRVAYDPPCHLVHAQGVVDPPLAVLAAVPSLAVLRHAEAEVCCGSAGVYSLLEPALSRAVLDRKVAALSDAAPDLVATGNPGCALQIGAGLRAAGRPIPVAHPVELLDRAYRAAGYYGDAAG